MPDLNQLYAALRNADAAGDVEGARKLAAYIKAQQAQPKPKESSFLDDVKQGAVDLGAGAIRGAGSIGATLVAPIDMISDAMDGKGLSLESNRARRREIDSGLQYLVGADPNSMLYKTGKLGGEIAGTLGAGGLVARGAAAVAPSLAASPTGTALLESIASGGLKAGGMTGIPGLAVRSAGGAINGGLTAGMANPDEVGSGALIGGAFPLAAKAIGSVGSAAGRTARKMLGGDVSPEVAALAQRAQELGIQVPADRIANSKPLNAVAAGLNYVPLSGRAATEARMQSQLDRALSKTFGQDSDNVTMALRKAQGDLGDAFDSALQKTKVRVDEQFLSDLVNASQRAESELGPDQARIIKNQIDVLMEKGATGEIEGQAAYNIKKTLDRIAKRNSPEAFYANDLKKDLMSALNRSMPDADARGFATVRKQYGNMLELQKLAQNGADGNVSIARVANLKNINNPDLQELADISAQFLKPREGMHGAAQRAGAGIGVGFLGGAPALGATIGAGRVGNTLLDSQLGRNFVLGQSPQLPPGLLAPLYRTAPLLMTDQ